MNILQVYDVIKLIEFNVATRSNRRWIYLAGVLELTNFLPMIG